MTKNQKEAYDFIKSFCDNYGVPPTYDEIAKGLGVPKTSAYSRCKPHRELLRKLKSAVKNGYATSSQELLKNCCVCDRLSERGVIYGGKHICVDCCKRLNEVLKK
jgi:hypothetical protein